jgi:hypothetical protein
MLLTSRANDNAVLTNDVRLVVLVFWSLAVLLVVAKFALVADINVSVVYGPHDDSLYIQRALGLLSGDGFGPYNSRTLVKYPGLSLWLAGVRVFGLPYWFTINLFYAAAGLYFCEGLARTGVHRLLLLAGFAFYLFNPHTLSVEWSRVLREPLATGLLLTLFGSMTYLLQWVRKGQFSLSHLIVMAIVLSFATLVREEDPLLYAAFGLFSMLLLFSMRPSISSKAWRKRLIIVIVPLLACIASNLGIRAFVDHYYGLPLIHDYSEGEFPKMIAAMRSVESAKDNRYVMITQEALTKLRQEIPRLAPVIDRLPPPSRSSYSCKWLGVCSEWSSGWLIFWIKDASFEAGLTPDLPTAQEFFRSVREDIKRACDNGRLSCRPRGSGVIPPFELKWTRAFVQELARLVAMLFSPDFNVISAPQPPSLQDTSLVRSFTAVTMMWSTAPSQDTIVNGNREYSNTYPISLGSARIVVASLYRIMSNALLLAGIASYALLLYRRDIPRQNVAVQIAVVFLGYIVVRILALSYLAVYMGHYESRMIFSIFAMLLFLSPVLIGLAVSSILGRDSTQTRDEKASPRNIL